jgi:hypothetical protein
MMALASSDDDSKRRRAGGSSSREHLSRYVSVMLRNKCAADFRLDIISAN